MPEISRFYGIIVAMFFDEHNPPQFHARYGEYKISIRIKDLAILSGSFPPRALGLVMEWAEIHKDELLKNWEKARNEHKLSKIKPLKVV